MKEFDVYVQNKPGELAMVCELLGTHGVNIRAISSERGSGKPMIRIVTDDETTTKSGVYCRRANQQGRTHHRFQVN